jgi:6-phosphogluconolactonase
MNCEIRVMPSSQEVFELAAEEFVRRANEAISENGRFTVALSGGSTPKALFQLLAESYATKLPWERMFSFWGDERHVPPDYPDSNYRMAKEALLSRVPIPEANVFRIPTEDQDASRAAANYEETLRKFFKLKPGEFPRFDLMLLGMGPDGHTASLFPHTAALREKTRLVAANWVEKFQAHRLTLTLPVINSSACVLFLVTGSDKAAALREVLASDSPADQFPAKLVQPVNGRLIWLVDRTAAAALPPTSKQGFMAS